MRLRAAREEDRPALLALWVAAWTRVFPAIDFAARRGWFAARLDALEAGGAQTTVAFAPDGAALGFAVFDPASGVMDQLCVAPQAQGSGAARALLDAIKRRSPGRVALTVNKDNARAVRFYLREGFVIDGEATNPTSGLPIWSMSWRLDGALTPRNQEPLH